MIYMYMCILVCSCTYTCILFKTLNVYYDLSLSLCLSLSLSVSLSLPPLVSSLLKRVHDEIKIGLLERKMQLLQSLRNVSLHQSILCHYFIV